MLRVHLLCLLYAKMFFLPFAITTVPVSFNLHLLQITKVNEDAAVRAKLRFHSTRVSRHVAQERAGDRKTL